MFFKSFKCLFLSWLHESMTKGYMRKLTSIADLCMLPESLWTGRVFNSFLSRFVKTSHNDYLTSPIIEPELLMNQEYLQRFISVRYEEDVEYRRRQSTASQQQDQVQNGLVRTMMASFGRKYALLGIN